jgi:hypothetical protein
MSALGRVGSAQEVTGNGWPAAANALDVFHDREGTGAGRHWREPDNHPALWLLYCSFRPKAASAASSEQQSSSTEGSPAKLKLRISDRTSL